MQYEIFSTFFQQRSKAGERTDDLPGWAFMVVYCCLTITTGVSIFILLWCSGSNAGSSEISSCPICFRETELLVEGLNFDTFCCHFLWIYFKILPCYTVPGPVLSNEEPRWLLSGPITGVQASTIERIESVKQNVMGLERGRGAGSVVWGLPEIWKKIVCSLSWGYCFLRFLPFALNHCPFHFIEFSLSAYAILHKLKIFQHIFVL